MWRKQLRVLLVCFVFSKQWFFCFFLLIYYHTLFMISVAFLHDWFAILVNMNTDICVKNWLLHWSWLIAIVHVRKRASISIWKLAELLGMKYLNLDEPKESLNMAWIENARLNRFSFDLNGMKRNGHDNSKPSHFLSRWIYVHTIAAKHSSFISHIHSLPIQ